MKKLIAAALIFLCLGAMTSCEIIGDLLPKEESETVYFIGKVLEKSDTGCLLEVTDGGDAFALSVGTLVHIGTNIESCPEYDLGDQLRVEFDGTVAESYPLQIFGVKKLEKVAD